MNGKSQLIVRAFSALITLTTATAFAANYEVDWHTVDNGGAVWSTGDKYEVSSTAAQPDAGTLTGDTYAVNGGFWYLGISAERCASDGDCYDGDYCTVDTCQGSPNGMCVYELIESRPHSDVFPVPDGDGAVEIMDTLCILDAASGIGDCLTDVGGYMIGDVYPCWPPDGTGPDGAVEIMDILFVLDAAGGEPRCPAWCP